MAIKILEKINAEQTAKLADKKFPEFHAGDIVRVSVRIKEGEKTRRATATACAWRSSSRSTARRSRRSSW